MPAEATSLPTVLMTDVIRSSQTGDSHGGAYLVDLATGESRQVLDWNDGSIDWAGRGGGRGLRGIAFRGDDIIIAASDEVFIFDRDFRVKASHRSPYLSHCHEIMLDGDTLWLTSTLFNSLLALDLTTGTFTRGIYLRAGRKPGPPGKPPETVYAAVAYDPSKNPRIPKQDVLHLNSVWVEDGSVYACGVRFDRIVRVRPDDLADGKPAPAEIHGVVPHWTHNARPYQRGTLCNSTDAERIQYIATSGKPTVELEIPVMPTEKLEHADTPGDIARPGFGRGLCLTDDGVVIGGASPSTITAYRLRDRAVLASVNLTRDVRNAPHGLEIWPFGGIR